MSLEMTKAKENITAGMVVALAIGIAVTLGLLSIHPPGGSNDIRQHQEARARAQMAAWQSYRDTNCSLLKAEIRSFNRYYGKAQRSSEEPVRVWRCPDNQLFDEVHGAIPTDWASRNPSAG
jgi:hypothetical protein